MKRFGVDMLRLKIGWQMFLIVCLLLSCQKTSSRIVRVGVYDNPPKIELSKNGIPNGIFIDILKEIADREGWKLDYINGTWEEGLIRLEQGQIDIMPDMAYSIVRNRQFDFNQITILSSWLQVYHRSGIRIETIQDLNNLRVAVLEGSIQHQVCDDLQAQFKITFHRIVLPDYPSIIRQVDSGRVDAVIVGRFYGYRKDRLSSLLPSPLILFPTTLHFAVAKGRNQDLIAAIDHHVSGMMNHSNSVYYHSLAYWLSEKPRMFIPQFIIWTIVTILSGFLLFLVMSLWLRRKVKMRTGELAEKNEELLKAMQELKSARDEALSRERLYAFGQLASGIAHDFNNLLIPIMGCSDMILDTLGDSINMEQLRRHVETIRHAADHGAQIVRRMQQFHHTIIDHQLKERIDMNTVIRDVIELSRLRLAKRSSDGTSIKVVLNMTDKTDIYGCKSDLHEVMLNLVLNAADAMTKGGLLEITTEKTDESIRIQVKDNGSGMPDDIKQQCLQPFFSTKGDKGTGMGLTMVNSIVQEYNGQIHIESSPGKGTCFMIDFPDPHF